MLDIKVLSLYKCSLFLSFIYLCVYIVGKRLRYLIHTMSTYWRNKTMKFYPLWQSFIEWTKCTYLYCSITQAHISNPCFVYPFFVFVFCKTPVKAARMFIILLGCAADGCWHWFAMKLDDFVKLINLYSAIVIYIACFHVRRCNINRAWTYFHVFTYFF